MLSVFCMFLTEVNMEPDFHTKNKELRKTSEHAALSLSYSGYFFCFLSSCINGNHVLEVCNLHHYPSF